MKHVNIVFHSRASAGVELRIWVKAFFAIIRQLAWGSEKKVFLSSSLLALSAFPSPHPLPYPDRKLYNWIIFHFIPFSSSFKMITQSMHTEGRRRALDVLHRIKDLHRRWARWLWSRGEAFQLFNDVSRLHLNIRPQLFLRESAAV